MMLVTIKPAEQADMVKLQRLAGAMGEERGVVWSNIRN